MYWDFVLLTIIDLLVELFGKWSENQTKFMESQLLVLPGIKVDHIVVLYSSASSEVIDILRSNVTFVPHIDQFEQIYQVEVRVLC